MELSDKQIHKLGSRLRNAYNETGVIPEEDLEMLQAFRMTYKDPIGKVFNVLYSVSHTIDSKSIVTYRIKRINSILEKLKRFPDSPLNRLIDIAGCRCIVHDTEQAYRVLTILEQSKDISIHRVKDYIKKPQPEGYRSLHIYVSHRSCPDKQVEIQVRDLEQHNWATLLEISDVILQTKLKEYNEPKDLLEFHRILSVPDEQWASVEKKHYFAMLNKYAIIDNLHKVFAQNILVRYDWMRSQGSSMKDFYLITVQANYHTSIQSFRTFKEAENAYFDSFAKDRNSNMVLTQIQNASYEQICTAYSNYVLSSHKFTDDCLNRYLKEIRLALDTENFTSYKTYLNSYYNAVANQVIYINQEQYFISNNKYPQKVQKQKIREWKRDTQTEINKLMERKKTLSSYYKNLPSHFSLFYLRVKNITLELGKQYDNKVKLNSPNLR